MGWGGGSREILEGPTQWGAGAAHTGSPGPRMSNVQVFSKPMTSPLVAMMGLFTSRDGQMLQLGFVLLFFFFESNHWSHCIWDLEGLPAQDGDLPLAERKRSLGKLWVCS